MSRRERGLIIGPNESEADFAARCNLPTLSSFPKRLKTLYGVSPDWVPVVYDNSGLRFWEGACSWLDNDKVTIQLRKRFKKRSHLWGLYSKEEILAHEGVHAARVAFEEPVFEEVLAYQTSKSPFRRYFGPLFRSPKESLLLVISTAILPFFSVLAPLFLALCTYGLLRLMRTQRRFHTTRNKLSKLFDHPAQNIMLHLTDREIILFAKSSLKNIQTYIDQQACFRWQQIKSECDVGPCCQSPVPGDTLLPSAVHKESLSP